MRGPTSKRLVHLSQVIALVAMTVIAALLLGPLRSRVAREAENIKTTLIRDLERNAGLTISYESIGPSIFSAVEIRGLSVAFSGGSFQARRVRLYLNLLKLIGREENDDPIRFVSRVTAETVDLEINASGSSTGTPMDPWPLLAEKAVILRELSAVVNLENGNRIDAVMDRLVLQDDADEVRFHFDSDVTLFPGESLVALGRPRAVLSGRGLFSPGAAALNARIDFDGISSSPIVFAPQSFDISFDENVAEIRRIGDQAPLDMAARIDISKNTWELDFEADRLRIGSLAAPGASQKALESWFETTVTGNGQLSGSTDDFVYDVDIAMETPPGPLPWKLTAVADVSGNRTIAEWRTLEVQNPWAGIQYVGNIHIETLTPEGRLSLSLDDDILGYPVLAEFDLSDRGGAIAAEPIRILAGDLSFADFRFLVINEGDFVTASLLAVPEVTEEGEAPRSVLADLVLETGDRPTVQAFASVQGIKAYHVVRLAGIDLPENAYAPLEDIELDFDGYFEAEGSSWVLAVDQGLMSSTREPGNRVEFRGRARPGNFALDNLHVAWNDVVVDGRASSFFDSNGGDGIARFVYEEEIFDLAARWDGEGRLTINGPHGLEGRLSTASALGKPYYLKVDEFPIALAEGVATVGIDMRGRLDRNGGEHFISSLQAGVTGKIGWPDPSVSVTGMIRGGTVELTKIEYSDRISSVVGSARIEEGRNDDVRAWLALGDGEGESYDVTVTRAGEDITGRISVRGTPLMRWDERRLRGAAVATADFALVGGKPTLHADVEFVDGRYEGRPLEAGGRFSVEEGRLRMSDLQYVRDDFLLERGLVLFDLETGEMRATASLGAEFNQVNVETGFSLAVDLDQGINIMDLPHRNDIGGTATLSMKPILWDGAPHLPAMTFHAKYDASGITVINPDRDILDAEINFDTGVVSVVSGYPLPVSSRVSGSVKDGYIDLVLADLEVDPVIINYVMPRDPILLQYHVVFQDGRFIGDLAVNGQVNDPDIDGILQVEDLQVDTPYTYGDIGTADTVVTFDGNTITFDPFEVRVGEGYMSGEGTMTMERWALTGIDMSFGARGDGNAPGVPAAYPMMGIDLDGLFTGWMDLRIDERSINLDGEFTFPVLAASMGDEVVPISQVPEGAYPLPIYLDFDFITGNNVTFYLPNEEFKVVSATAEPDQVINLLYNSDPETLSLTGGLPIKTGDIYYFDRSFQVTDGSLVFNESLERFNPQIAFRAETRVRDDEGDEVTVALEYDAPVMDDFDPLLVSDPPRTDLEILALFGQAVLPYGELAEADVSTVILASGGIVSQMGLVQPFEQAIKKGLNLDMVTIQTDIIENALAEGLDRDEDVEGGSTSANLGRYLDNTSFYAGKYIGGSLFLSGSITANYLEGQRLRSVFGGLEFETAVSLEMQTPLFAVGWSYQPDSTSKKNFVENQNISLKWKFSY